MSLHIVVFPWLALGHHSPFFQLSQELAERGHQVSFISTPRNIKRLPKLPQNLASLINFVEFNLPQVEHLPPNAEATCDLPLDKVPYLKIAFDRLESALASFLETSLPDWIIHDFAPYWLPPIAAKLNIPTAYFSVFSAVANLGFFGSPSGLVGHNSSVFRKFENAHLAATAFVENESGVSDAFRFQTAFKTCTIFAIRSCPEFESEELKLLQEKLHGKPILHVGLLPPHLGGTEEDQKWEEIKEWLDKQQPESVVYVAFGTEASPNQQQAAELALGLELSGLSFFWVLKNPAGSTEPAVLPSGFEDRVKGRGIVWRSWVPQLRILSHPSMGGSLMHSGWGSVIESLGVGLPLVLLPMVNDQAIMAVVLERQKIGLQIPRNDEDGSFTGESVAASLRKVMVEKEGEHYRTIAKDLRKLFGDKLGQDSYFDDFVGYLKDHRLKRSDRLTDILPFSSQLTFY